MGSVFTCSPGGLGLESTGCCPVTEGLEPSSSDPILLLLVPLTGLQRFSSSDHVTILVQRRDAPHLCPTLAPPPYPYSSQSPVMRDVVEARVLRAGAGRECGQESSASSSSLFSPSLSLEPADQGRDSVLLHKDPWWGHGVKEFSQVWGWGWGRGVRAVELGTQLSLQAAAPLGDWVVRGPIPRVPPRPLLGSLCSQVWKLCTRRQPPAAAPTS